MKSAPQALIDLLNSNQQYVMADLYTFSLVDGTVLRYTSFDIDITYGGNVFSASGPLFQRGRTRVVLGVEVDTLDLSIFPGPANLVGGVTFLQAAAQGRLDGATLKLERAFLSPVPTAVGGFINFSGRVADLQLSRTEIRATVKSDLELLNIKMPRNLYQPGCLHTLYDTDCGVVRASVAGTSTALTGSTATSVLCGLSQAAGWFDLGYLQFTSGSLAGTKRTVKSYAPGVVSLLNPLPQAPEIGAAFTIYPGCDKQQTTCSAKFNNLAAFRAFPYIPVPETAL